MASESFKSVLLSLMKEVNLNPKIQEDLMQFAVAGKPFPYVPKQLLEPKAVVDIDEKPKRLQLPPRPMQRSKFSIEESGSYEREMFRPDLSKTRPAREKERFQNVMAFGEDIEERRGEAEKGGAPDIEAVDLFDEILTEIRERSDFLEDMMRLGEGKKYISQIQCQIAVRLKELEQLDKKRAEKIRKEYEE